MKIFKLLFLMSFIIKCQAQNPIVGLSQSRMNLPNGYYIKDINNDLNVFEGTYIYTNGTTSLTINLLKKMQQYNGVYYEDLIIGEYQYIENGIEKANTLSQINNIYNDQKKHNIYGNWIVDNNFRYWKCPQCNINENRLSAAINDVSTDISANFTMRRTIENGQQVMKIKISHITNLNYSPGQTPLNFSLPQGELTLIKQ